MQGDDESIDEIEIEIDLEDKDEGTSRVPGDPTRDRDPFRGGKSADAGQKTPPPIPRDARDKGPGRGR